MSTRIQIRRDTAANWTTANPILAVGELALEIDTRRHKTGDGSSTWTVLTYDSPILAAVASSGAYVDLTGKPAIPAAPGDIGAQPAGSYATTTALTSGLAAKADAAGTTTALAAKADATATTSALAAKADLVGGVIPTAQIPALALMTTVPVANQAAMLALTTTQVQPGDIAIRADGTGSFILTAADPSQLANWASLDTRTDVVTSVNGQLATVVLGKAEVGLGSVDNTADVAKPVSTAQAAAIASAITTAEARANHTGTQAASTVTGLAAVATSGAKADVGLGNVDNTSDANKPLSTATTMALAGKADAGLVLSGPAITLTANGTLTAGVPNVLDATTASVTATLPTPTKVGQILPVERIDVSTTNPVAVTGTIRGTTMTITLPAMGVLGEGLLFEAESLTSWRPIAGHKPTSWLDARYDPRGAAAGLALVFGA